MSVLELWTGIALWVLIGGSIAVFVWFAYDLLKLGVGSPARGDPPADGEGA